MGFKINSLGDDARDYYEELGQEFCRYYYNMFDGEFPSLSKLYVGSPCITFNNKKFSTLYDVYLNLIGDGIWSFKHNNITGNCQPMGENSVLINVNGFISINSSFKKYKFNETIVLTRENCYASKFYISNSIFKLID